MSEALPHMRGYGSIRCYSENAPLPPLETYGRCRGCKHWGTPDLWPHLAECGRIDDNDRDDPLTLATVVDHEGYSAVLWTNGGFGCRLWDAKETA